MANEGIAVIIGVAVAAIAAIGTFVYQRFQERQQEQEWQQNRPRNQQSQHPSQDRSYDSTPPEQERRAICGRCKGPLAGCGIERLRCRHVFHDFCVLGVSVCPFPGCGRKIREDWQ